MLLKLRNHLARHHAVHLAGVQISLVAVLCVAFAAASGSALPAYAHLEDAPVVRARLVQRVSTAVPPAAQAPEAEPADPGVIRLQDLAPDAARQWNASNPISTSSNPAAKPFNLAAEGVLDEARATDCMTAAIYYEAGYESTDGQRAVAQVVLNRLRNPLFPKTVCGVVFQGSERSTGCQFTFTCDGALGRKPSEEAWERARKVAVAALHGYVMKKVGNATHYHADYVAPYWSPTLVKVAVVGQHIFYRWPEGARQPAGGGRTPWDEPVLQVATLDDIPPALDKLTPAPQQPAAPPLLSARPVAIAAAKPVAPAVERAADRMADAGAAAAKAGPILTPRDLDWQGRPRQGPPRLARPDSF